MKWILVTLFSMSLTANAQIRAQDAADFKNLLNVTIEKGKKIETDAGIYLMIESEASDKTTSRREYFSSVGGFNEKTIFEIDHAEAVRELWTLDAQNNSNIDQWVFLADPVGNLILATHHVITESLSHQIIRDQDMQPDEYTQTKEWYFERAALEKKFLP